MSGESARRSFVRLDRYAPFDIARDCRLSANESKLLTDLCLLADFRSAEWRGTITELAAYTRLTRKTVASAIEKLATEHLIDTPQEFGPNRPGTIRVLAFADLTLDAKPDLAEQLAQIRAIAIEESRPIRAQLAPDSRSTRANLREFASETSDDARPRGSAVERMRGTASNEDLDEEMAIDVIANAFALRCEVCHQRADAGHPFDHDPVLSQGAVA